MLGSRRDELDLAGVVGAFPAGAGGPDLIQAEAAGHHDQPAAFVLDLVEIGTHQAGERVLDDVFGRADVAEYPEGEVNEVGTVIGIRLADLPVVLPVHATSSPRPARLPWRRLLDDAAPRIVTSTRRSGRCHFLASRAVLACDVRPPDGAASTR